MKSRTKSFIILMLTALFLAGYLANNEFQKDASSSSQVIEAFKNKKRDIQVSGGGKVVKILRDDLKGSRHQRIIVQIDTGLTVLIAHNIDLAPRINDISPGDHLLFYGEYEWNDKGGVIHWTHHDPRKRHPDGWLKFKGQTYQ